MAVLTGTQIASYRILEKLGEGGMGVVYKAIDTTLDRTVAIKVLGSQYSGSPDVLQRFHAEAKAQANLNHPNLATLYTLLMHNGDAFMVMEYVDGQTVEQMIRRRGPIPAAEALPIFKQALLGIGYAHRAGIVHRDIKPANLMINRSGVVKVMDFGLAKVAGTRGITKTGTHVGTGWYMSPEQVLNKTVDTRSDIYSLGVTLFQMLTAHVPFETGSEFEIMSAHVSSPPPLPTKLYSKIPKPVEYAVLKALEKLPSHRFQTVEEFAAAFDQKVVPAVMPPADRTPRPQPQPALAQHAAETTVTMVMPPQTASKVFVSSQRKLLGGIAALILVIGVGLLALRGIGPQPEKATTAPPIQSPSAPTPLEQQVSTASPPVETSAPTPTSPKVAFFLADPAIVDPGATAHLSWSVSDASQVLIAPAPGIVKAEGTADLPIQKTTTFTLIAKNEKGESTTNSVTVRVRVTPQGQPQADSPPPPPAPEVGHQVPADNPNPPQPVLREQTPPTPARVLPGIVFDASPTSIQPGGAATLHWNLTNAQTAMISPVPGTIRGASGQIRVLPTQTTTYTLTAISRDGGTSTSSVTIEVSGSTRPGK